MLGMQLSLESELDAAWTPVSERTVARGRWDGLPVELVLEGQAQSKSNRRKVVKIAGKARLIKSKEALAIEQSWLRQIPVDKRVRLEGDLVMELRIFYGSARPDLDASLVFDVLQDRWGHAGSRRVLLQAGVYRNDRQVKELHAWHAIDAGRPRVEVKVWPKA